MNTTNTLVRSYNEEKLGQRIKYIREKMNFSRKEIGDLLQVSYQQIQKYETGKNRISAMSLKKMSMIFDIPVDTFFIDDHDYSQLVQTAIE
ncbi:MAG: helix-turn-helix transcriptional regulator, partial [Cyclobacteriaceae bacterium]